MAVSILNLMERSGYDPSKLKFAIEVIKDAIFEIQLNENLESRKSFYSLEEDKRYYSLPSGSIRILGVYYYDEDDTLEYMPMRQAAGSFIPDDDELTTVAVGSYGYAAYSS